MNITIVPEINLWSYLRGTDFTLAKSLLRAVKLNKNTDLLDWLSIGFNTRIRFLLSDDSGFVKNMIIFRADKN